MAMVVDKQCDAIVSSGALSIAGRVIAVVAIEVEQSAYSEKIAHALRKIRTAVLIVAVTIHQQSPSAGETLFPPVPLRC